MAENSIIAQWLQHHDDELLYSADTEDIAATMERRRVALETIVREGREVVRLWARFEPHHGSIYDAVARLAVAIESYQLQCGIHCWHDTESHGMWYPPQRIVCCCHCATKKYTSIVGYPEPTDGHGPFHPATRRTV